MRILRSVLGLSQFTASKGVQTPLVHSLPQKSFSNRLLLSHMSTTSTAQWDAELGVWVGERAPFCDQSELPDPLYILGYGSLIWRPGELLEKCKTFKCTALGSMRIFAQKSCDHRGTPEFPGLVLNLVKDEMLEELGYREPGSPQSDFRGMVWLVPPELAHSVIEDLDYRERGGYHRHTITVKLDRTVADGEQSSGEGVREVVEEVVQALVYTGAPSNPNFHLPAHPRQRRRLDTALIENAAIEDDIRVEPRMDPFDLHRRNIMTDTIAAAVGPSGPNVDYLCNLERFLNSSGMHDPFLTRLAASVRQRLGPWRSRLYRATSAGVHVRDDTAGTVRETALSGSPLPFPLLGWGSNEFVQLSSAPAVAVITSAEDAGPNRDTAEARREALLAHRYAATSLSTSLPPFAPPGTERTQSTRAASFHPGSMGDPGAVEGRFVVAGGGTSAVLDNGVARVWGKLAPELLKLVAGGAEHATGVEEMTNSVLAGDELDQYRRSILIEDVHGAAIGNDHLLLLLHLPVSSPAGESTEASAPREVVEVMEVVVAVGSDTHGQCSGSIAACAAVGIICVSQADIVLLPSRTISGAFTASLRDHSGVLPVMTTPGQEDKAPGGRVLKLAVGMRHSVLVTEAGELVTWGDARHGQCLTAAAGSSTADSAPVVPRVWRPQSGAKVVDVACGARHTVVLDSLGVAYQLGTTTAKSAVERRDAHASGEPEVVQGLPDRVRWQRVASGWSHVVLRGLSADADRSLVYYAWGKQNLCQFPAETSGTSGTVVPEGTPVPLDALPGGRTAAEVWCGSEFTMAADVDGGLWGCGWNEHGNLGVGAPSQGSSGADADNVHSVVSTWQSVVHAPNDKQESLGVRLRHSWEGAVACGGGHVLCLPW